VDQERRSPASALPGPPQLDLLKALGDNTRYAIYLELARSARPLATSDISESLDLHPNTVRPHLERMREAGLLDVEVGGRGDVGRPQHRYSIAPNAPSLGFEPPTMPVLARMVLSMAARLQASADDAEAVGRTEGATRAQPYQQARRHSKRWCPISTDSGSTRSSPTPATIPTPPSSRSATARSPNWPQPIPNSSAACTAASSPASSPEMGDAEVDEFCPLTSRTPCRVTVASR
jgi:DNA-binding transcriptional ArsR family regulator